MIHDLYQLSPDPTTNGDFKTVVSSSNFPNLDAGHECCVVPNAPSSVSSGFNATLQPGYISQFETDNNKTFYLCADITCVLLTQFITAIPCFNVAIDDPAAGTFSAIAGAPTTSTNAATISGSSAAHTSNPGGSSSLSGGAIAGIVAGPVVGAELISGVLFLSWRHYQQKAPCENVISVKVNELTNPAPEDGNWCLLPGFRYTTACISGILDVAYLP
ncbi:hypothetical protein EIK77_007546 [Talaromyces pinophilus]|nr:hypothetical protein EIK77_007546 [Talaromyces pinophilus]